MHTDVTRLLSALATTCLLSAVAAAQPTIRGIGVPAGYTASFAGWVTADGERVLGTATHRQRGYCPLAEPLPWPGLQVVGIFDGSVPVGGTP